MDKEIQILAPQNLPLDLEELGLVTEADLVMPGVYNAVLENPETGLAVEAFIVLKSTPEISDMAKSYGKAVPIHPGLLVYQEDRIANTRYIIGYELFRYRILHGLPLPEGENIRSIAAIGAEKHPGYFGCYPAPFLTPWGCTTRHKVITNGLYWLETEQCQRGLAVAYPKFDDLSDGARGLAERFDDGSAHTNGQNPGCDKEVPNQPSRTPKIKKQGATPGPLFFHVLHQSTPAPATKAHAPQGIQARQSQRGQVPKTCPAHRRGIASSGHTFGPALCPRTDTHPRPTRGGPPSRRPPQTHFINNKKTACIAPDSVL